MRHHTLRRALALGIGAGAVFASPAGRAVEAAPPEALRFTTVDQGIGSCAAAPAGRPELRVIRGAREWRAFWAEHVCGGDVPAPAVNFSRRMVLAYLADPASQGAASAAIQEVLLDRARGILHVLVEEETAQPGPAASRPFHVVATRRVAARVDLRREEVWPFHTIDAGGVSYRRYGEEGFAGENLVLRDEKAYLDLWADHTGGVYPPPPPPVVAFPGEMVVAVFFGYWPADGASIRVVRIVRTWQGVLRVEVLKEARPGFLTVVTNPFHLVAAPAFDGPVVVAERGGP
jgi:hypothetical protein